MYYTVINAKIKPRKIPRRHRQKTNNYRFVFFTLVDARYVPYNQAVRRKLHY